MIAVGIVMRGDELPAARVLARTLARFHPEWPVTGVLLPGLRPELHPDREPFTLVSALELLGQDLKPLLTTAPSAATVPLLRPLLAAHLLEEGAQRVLILAAETEVHGPLDALGTALQRGSAVLVPRLRGLLPDDGERPDGQDLLDAGEIDDGVVAIRAGEGGSAFVRWWGERTLAAAQGVGDASAPRFASPLGAARRVFGDLVELDDDGYGVGFWNLHERPLALSPGGPTAAGAPLRLMRWEGFRPDRPWWLSAHATRVLLLDDPVLVELSGSRVRALREAGWIRPDVLDAGELPGGVRFDVRLQRLHAEAVDAGATFGDVFTRAGAEAFLAWLAEPAPQGGAAGVNRYAYDAWRDREDLQAAYPDLDADAEGFLGWLWVHGRPEMRLQDVLLPTPPTSIADRDDGPPPVLVTGYLRGHLGLGQAARGVVSALQAADVPVATRTVAPDPPVERRGRGPGPRPEEREFADVGPVADLEPEVNVLCVNADQLPGFMDELGEELGSDRYTIGQWAWETDLVPDRWERPFSLVDEVWVYSRYVADAISRAGDVPVVVVPLPVQAPDPQGADVPSEVDVGDAFVFLFAFDHFSTLARKNPVGLIDAFTRAFAPGEGPVLVIKTINARFRPEDREHLRAAIGDRPDIRLFDAALDPGPMAALFARADAYVSLHRSEGYGLTMAEAMALGKPVIATGYSGNTDFMTPANSFLVDWRLEPVGDDAEHYNEGGSWAQPDLDHAARLMREVFSDREGARRVGDRAAADIAAVLSPEAIGRVARARLEKVRARRRGRPHTPEVTGVHPDLVHRLGFDLSGGAGSGARGAARRAIFRAMRPYTSAERSLDQVLAESVQRLALEVQGGRAALEREHRAAALRERRLAELELRVEALSRQPAPERQDDWLRHETRRLVEGSRAVPFTEGEPFRTFDHPVAGRVQGFRDGTAAAVAAERSYRSFEDVFRGDRERVAGLAAPYVDLLRGHAPVIDVGCGRGELLELLRDAGIEARGVDLDAGMAEVARERGLDVTVEDAVSFLEREGDGTLGAIVSMQVIEHVPQGDLRRLLALAHAKLRPGGLFVAETVNPHAAHALKTFWVDLTHQHPVFPEVTLALAADAGFEQAFIWHPLGSRDVDRDRFQESSYALVATR
jgi:glycosyltransferase involved in cell wall biosynthesis/2-polyprenyl-3-methyl-5-hydroxy-6-metoxy-1,4-benzoquinol methylase